MQNEAFKIMGALLVLVLAVTFSVGAVSAATNEYNIGIDIKGNAMVLTADVPSYIQTPEGDWVLSGPTGDFVTAKSAFGVLRTAYAYELKDASGNIYIPTLNVNYSTDTVTQIGSYSSSSSYVWTVFKGTTKITDLATPVLNDDTVSYLLVPSRYANSGYSTQLSRATAAYIFTANFVGVNQIYENSIQYTNGMTGVAALDAASNNQVAFTYNVTYPWGSAWLNHINYISPDYTKTGYGWGILLSNSTAENQWCPSLDLFTVSPGDTLKIWMMPSVDAGNFAGETPVGVNTAQYSNGYYALETTDKVTITVTA